jgi:hypothetical protein
MSSSVDEEWANFNSHEEDGDYESFDADYDDTDNIIHNSNKLNNKMDFKHMCNTHVSNLNMNIEELSLLDESRTTRTFSLSSDLVAPIPSEIYISTKSIIEYLDTPIDIKSMFWNIEIMPYSTKSDGVIKKQIKFNSLNEEELLAMQSRLSKEPQYDEHIIKSINNPDGRIKFKDVRKLSVGMSKKDVTHICTKKKSAFYNCLVLILRLKIDGMFREFHVKIFNTGKMELPGMQIESTKKLVLTKIVEIIQPHMDAPVGYLNRGYTILINSNFNCGFYINREALYSILKTKYNIETIYDICSYPGIQCKLYHDSEEGICFKNTKSGLTKVSFMIFRTGSILIVGMINEEALFKVYDYIKQLLQDEYHLIGQKMPAIDPLAKTEKTPRKKMINITVLKSDLVKEPNLFSDSGEVV